MIKLGAEVVTDMWKGMLLGRGRGVKGYLLLFPMLLLGSLYLQANGGGDDSGSSGGDDDINGGVGGGGV